MTRPLVAAAAGLLALAGYASAADPKLTVKVEDTAPPKELAEPIRAILDGKAMHVLDDKGELVAEIWLRKELPGKATEEQVKNGLTYKQIPETSIIGVVRTARQLADYRKQKVPAGVYTLRLAYQPMDGDHMGTAPYNDFCLLCPADQDKKPELLDPRDLHELSAKTIGRKHPGLMLLFPNKMPAEAPAVEAKPKEHFVLSYRVPVTASGQKTNLGFSLVVVGVTMAE